VQGKRTAVIDFDIGLRNLDIHLGCERRIIFDFVNVSCRALCCEEEEDYDDDGGGGGVSIMRWCC
jgi:hypothetical protein